jgi:hypothetical protein
MHPSVLSKYTSQDLGNTSWAFAKLGVLHEPLMDALAERCLCPEVSATFNTQNVANVAWAFARLGIRYVEMAYSAPGTLPFMGFGLLAGGMQRLGPSRRADGPRGLGGELGGG